MKIATQLKNKTLITTNVRLPREELLTYREYALSEGKSFSQLVREVLARAIIFDAAPNSKRSSNKKRSFWDIDAYSITLGDAHASETVDASIYNDI